MPKNKTAESIQPRGSVCGKSYPAARPNRANVLRLLKHLRLHLLRLLLLCLLLLLPELVPGVRVAHRSGLGKLASSKSAIRPTVFYGDDANNSTEKTMR